MADEFPGLLLKLKSSKRVAGVSGRQRVHVELDADISDPKLWEGMEEQLRLGIPINSNHDLNTEILIVLRDEVKRLEAVVKERERQIQTKDLIILAYREGINPGLPEDKPK